MKKYKVIEILNHLPDEFDVEELVEKLLFVEKVEKGMQDAEEGKAMSLAVGGRQSAIAGA